MKSQFLRNLFIIFSALLFESCSNDALWQEVKELEGDNWKQGEKIKFSFDKKLEKDTLYDIAILVRHSIDYPFDNLYIKYRLVDASLKFTDSTLFNLSLLEPETGKPFGDANLGFGTPNLFTHTIWLKRGVKLPTTPFSIDIEHYMRTEKLNGVYSLGFQLYYHTPTEEEQKAKLKPTEREEW